VRPKRREVKPQNGGFEDFLCASWHCSGKKIEKMVERTPFHEPERRSATGFGLPHCGLPKSFIGFAHHWFAMRKADEDVGAPAVHGS
jgi:hypothetical protein